MLTGAGTIKLLSGYLWSGNTPTKTILSRKVTSRRKLYSIFVYCNIQGKTQQAGKTNPYPASQCLKSHGSPAWL